MSSESKSPAISKVEGPEAPKPAFSFTQVIADLQKPRADKEAPEAVESGPPETEEEKRKRICKMERRKLRVSFKEGDDLAEIRLFRHDPEEEMGHDENMIRDVGDINSEGRMLKMHAADFMDLDDDEDTPINPTEDLAPWTSPSRKQSIACPHVIAETLTCFHSGGL
jgi:hypothetical protein